MSGSLGVEAVMLDCEIVVCEFEFHLRYFVHFRINILGKGLNPQAVETVK